MKWPVFSRVHTAYATSISKNRVTQIGSAAKFLFWVFHTFLIFTCFDTPKLDLPAPERLTATNSV
jgi:hypothetical protein